MRFHPYAVAVLSALAFTSQLGAQETLSDLLDDPAVSLSRPADRARVVARMGEIEATRSQNARARATLLGLPLRTEQPNGRVQEVADFRSDGRPLFRTTHNVNAAISTGADLLRTSPYSLSGSGVTIGLWDGGSARSTHQEFGGRVIVMDGAASIDHATHVGGTLIATGVVAAAHGMAASAIINSYDWNSDITEMTARGATSPGQADKIYLSNHSYGYISGWNYVNGGSPYRLWEWYGSGTSSTSIEPDFGTYNSYARSIDSLAVSAPYYLIFRSAGNDRTDNPASGDAVALSAGGSSVVSYSPTSHPAGDGTYRGGFDTIGYEALAKDVITIGSTSDAVTSGLRDPSKANVSSFSSWGPTDDGRIKPDLVANGEALYSSLNGSNTSYGTYSGTSMATPDSCGSAALLIQQYGNLFPGQAMRASTLKGLLIHTADDRGNTGPDYKYGWGLVNVKAAADIIADHYAYPEKQRITENQLTTSITSRTQSFVWDGVSPIRATLCWTDPAGTSTTSSDSRTARLVNNLNLKLIAPNGTEFFPFVMPFVGTWTQASMDLPATTGVNNTDNIEQVLVAAPPVTGTYQAVVSFSGSLTGTSQNYSLILSAASAEPPPPPPLALSSINPNNGLANSTVTVDLTGTSLRADTTVKLTKSGQTDITATSVQLIGETLRCQLNLTGAATGTWNVVATNPDLSTSTLANSFTVVGSIWSENFDGGVSGWASDSIRSGNSWSIVTNLSHSPASCYFAPGPSSRTTTALVSPAISVPAGANNLQLKFFHRFSFQSSRRDGGVLEFQIDNGAWTDIADSGSGNTFASNPYQNTINSSQNDLNGRSAWTGNSGNAFVETIVNLNTTSNYAGKSLRFRWIIATNNTTTSNGWYVDSIALTGGGDLSNQPPAITSAATSSSTETVTDPDSTTHQIIRGMETNLSVTATDDGGDSALTYTWSLTNGPAPMVFSQNGTNAAKNTTASFQATGDYRITVAVADAQGLTVTSAVDLRVLQTADGLIVSPASATLPVGATQSFSATLLDQFGAPMASQPGSFTWSASGGGTINTAGVFTATTAGGPYVVTATSGSFSNIASVTVNPAPASLTLSSLDQTYDGSPKPVTVTTNPAGLTVAVTYNGSSTVPTNASIYAVEASITNPNYQGSAAGTLVIHQATATVVLSNLTQVYDDSPKPVTVTTMPSDLSVTVTYNGSSTPPTNAATYAIAATVNDSNYQGSASGYLEIQKAAATVVLSNLTQTYDGSPKPVSTTTTPGSLAVDVTYNGSTTPPTNVGTYSVNATVNASNYQGSASGTMEITKALATVVLSNLTQTYDGTPKPVTLTTTPASLTVTLTYDGLPDAPTNAGTYAVVATVNDSNYQGTASGSLIIEPGNDLVSWKNAHFTEAEQSAGLAADNADPDSDGLQNLAEYALGTDPRQFTPPLVPTLDANGLSLSFTRPANLPGLNYSAESSEGIDTWTPVPLEVIQEGDPETVRARDPLTNGDPSKRFLRLRFEHQ
jgi:hypothetical protein